MKRYKCLSPGCEHDATLFAVIVNSGGIISEPAVCTHHVGDVHIDYSMPDLRDFGGGDAAVVSEECGLYAVLTDNQNDVCTIILRALSGERGLAVPTGYIEGGWISNIARSWPFRNTSTHELIRNIVHELGGSLIEANIHGYDKTTGIFQCYLAIEASAGRKVLNCRVSDAVAICHFAKIPIVVNSALLGELKVAD